jgi:hypothetical protein
VYSGDLVLPGVGESGDELGSRQFTVYSFGEKIGITQRRGERRGLQSRRNWKEFTQRAQRKSTEFTEKRGRRHKAAPTL